MFFYCDSLKFHLFATFFTVYDVSYAFHMISKYFSHGSLIVQVVHYFTLIANPKTVNTRIVSGMLNMLL